MGERDPKWRCAYASGCGREVSDAFYQQMIRDAGHPPRCVCSVSLLSNRPWTPWVRASEGASDDREG